MDSMDAFTDKDYKTYFKENFADLIDIESLPPELLSEYTFESCVNETGVKSVYIVRHKHSNALGLLKITHAKSVENAQIEASILRSLQHPGIPRVLDFWEYNGSAYLIREYFEGVPLNIQYAKNGVFPASEILYTAQCIGEILDYLESRDQPVIHRDIKPNNIILTIEHEYKLIDFGVARKYDPAKTKDTSSLGTEDFIAPEQAIAQQTTSSADRYGLGKTLLYLATGEKNLTEGISQIDHEGLRNLITVLTDMNPKKRFASASDMMNHIRYLKDGIDPLSMKGVRVSGNILTSYTGNDKKLVLYDVAYILPDAFAEHGESIEEIRLCANFSVTSVPALRMLKNLAYIEVDENNNDLVGYEGVLYDKQTSIMVLFPPEKAGACKLPEWINGIKPEAYEDMCRADSIENFVCEENCEHFATVDGVLYDKSVREMIICPRAKTGIINIPDTVCSIRQQAFHRCVGLTDVGIPLERKGEFRSYGHYLCALFDGCINLPREFQHDLYFEGIPRYKWDSERDISCACCNEIRSLSEWGFLQNIMSDNPEHKSIREFKLPSSPSPGIARTIVTGPNVQGEYKELGIPADIPDGLALKQIVWDLNEEVHSGVTYGTEGGWMDTSARLGYMAWLDKGAVLLAGGSVLGKARISGNSRVEYGGRVFDRAVVDGESVIKEGAEIYGYAHVTNAIVQNAHVYGNAIINGIDVEITGGPIGSHIIPKIYDKAMVEGYATISGSSMINENARIADYAQICGDAKIYGSALIGDYAIVGRGGVVCENAKAIGHAHIGSISLSGTTMVDEGPVPWKSAWETGERQPRR